MFKIAVSCGPQSFKKNKHPDNKLILFILFMFQVLDLSGRPLPELKEIAKAFSIDSKNLAKGDIILKIVDAQSGDAKLTAEVMAKFSKKEMKEPKEKRPRKGKAEPIARTVVHEAMPIQQESEPEATPEPEPQSVKEPVAETAVEPAATEPVQEAETNQHGMPKDEPEPEPKKKQQTASKQPTKKK